MGRIEILDNLAGLSELLGGFTGVSEGVENEAYIASVIRSAHRKATNIFDAAAAASARAGKFRHMYEYGVQGITEGTPSHPDPMSADARLWSHTIVGKGREQIIGFTFRPARTPNPQPTTARTGVPSKYLRKLSQRKYIFREKAMVMETGQEVSIEPKNGRFLFIPVGKGASSNPVVSKRGYMMYDASRLGPITVTPGRNVQGNFGKFWSAWWRGPGGQEMTALMGADIENDIAGAIARTTAQAEAEGRKLTRPESAATRYAYTRGAKLTKAIFQELAQRGYVNE